MDFTEPNLACPVVADFDPLDQGFLDDPYAGLDRVRDHGPVFFSPVLDRWVVTGYAEIEQVLLEPPNYSAVEVLRPLYPLCERATEILGGLARVATMPNADPPQHVRYRSAMMRVISPRRMAELEPIIRARCDELIDTVRPQGRAEVVAALCHPLPAATMFA